MAAIGEQLVDIGDSRLIANRSGGLNFCHDGRTHHQERRSDNSDGSWSAYFKCAQCSKHRVQIFADSNNVIYVVLVYSGHLHSCESNEAAIVAEEARLRFLEESRSPTQLLGSRIALRQAFNEIQNGLSPSAQVQLGQYRSNAGSGRRHRNDALFRDVSSPNTISEMPLDIPLQFTQLVRANSPTPTPFLLWYEKYTEDDGDNEAMFMIFGTMADLIHLIQAEHLFADGTHDATPMPFCSGRNARSGQLFTINTLFGLENSQRLYTRLYVLTTRRTERFYRLMYKAIFSVLLDNVQGFQSHHLKWRRFSLDFELAHVNALTAVSVAYFGHIGNLTFEHQHDHVGLLNQPIILLPSIITHHLSHHSSPLL
jgi:hypothetical protein